MDRRKFFSLSSASSALLAASSLAGAEAQPTTRGTQLPLKVKLGHELDTLDDKSLSYAARLGVEWVGAEPKPADPARAFVTTDELKAARALVEKHRLHLEIISCALLNSS